MNALGKAVTLAIALLAFTGVAYADKDQKGEKGFKKVDIDNNGAISMEEARTVPGLADNFAAADKNGDGQLSKSEYEAAKKSHSKQDKGDKAK